MRNLMLVRYRCIIAFGIAGMNLQAYGVETKFIVIPTFSPIKIGPQLRMTERYYSRKLLHLSA